MEMKVLELRDEGTVIPVIAVDMNPPPAEAPNFEAVRYLLHRCGYACDGRPNIVMTWLGGGGKATNDPDAWDAWGGGRTFRVAHEWIIQHWDSLVDGDVVDVEFILGETAAPKASARSKVEA